MPIPVSLCVPALFSIMLADIKTSTIWQRTQYFDLRPEEIVSLSNGLDTRDEYCDYKGEAVNCHTALKGKLILRNNLGLLKNIKELCFCVPNTIDTHVCFLRKTKQNSLSNAFYTPEFTAVVFVVSCSISPFCRGIIV